MRTRKKRRKKGKKKERERERGYLLCVITGATFSRNLIQLLLWPPDVCFAAGKGNGQKVTKNRLQICQRVKMEGNYQTQGGLGQFTGMRTTQT